MISPKSFSLTGGFQGRAIERCRTNSTTTNLRCQLVMATKFETKTAITPLV